MVALNFKKQFADDVEEGRKNRSIRAPRRDGRPNAERGSALQLYTGMRSKSCRKLRDTICKRIRPVTIDAMGIILAGKTLFTGHQIAAWGSADPEAFDGDFAIADGFDSFDDMVIFFEKEHGLPFHGFLIEWPAP